MYLAKETQFFLHFLPLFSHHRQKKMKRFTAFPANNTLLYILLV